MLFRSPYMFAVMHALLGEKDIAFDWLERALAARDVNLLELPADVRLRSLQDDPRFADVARRCACGVKPASRR